MPEKKCPACDSKCCTFIKKAYSLTIEQIDALNMAVKNHLADFKPEYQERVKQIVNSGEFLDKKFRYPWLVGYPDFKPTEKDFDNYLKADQSRLRGTECMQDYFACIFLSDNRVPTGNAGNECMIYSHRFDFCKNTTAVSFGCVKPKVSSEPLTPVLEVNRLTCQ